MDLLTLLQTSLFSPMVLAYLLGVVAVLIRSDLSIPADIYAAISLYLLFAIGLKGGAQLDGVAWGEVGWAVAVAVGLSCVIPVWSYAVLRCWGRYDRVNAAALAAHYGSASAVTFSAAMTFVERAGEPGEAYLPALLAVMEVPAIVVALLLAGGAVGGGAGGSDRGGWARALHEVVTGKGVVLLLGGLGIGLLGGRAGFAQVAPLFDAPFKGMLTFFLLEVGLVTGRRLGELRKCGWFLPVFAVVMPLGHGVLGVWLGRACGLGLGGATVLGALAASASYIAAPAAVRVALPQASPVLYLTASLAITFPFNIVIGIPVYFAFARWLFGR